MPVILRLLRSWLHLLDEPRMDDPSLTEGRAAAFGHPNRLAALRLDPIRNVQWFGPQYGVSEFVGDELPVFRISKVEKSYVAAEQLLGGIAGYSGASPRDEFNGAPFVIATANCHAPTGEWNAVGGAAG